MLNKYCAVTEKIHTHTKKGHQKFLGGGVLKAKILEAKYEAKLGFPGGGGGGWGVQNKKPSVGAIWIFFGPAHWEKMEDLQAPTIMGFYSKENGRKQKTLVQPRNSRLEPKQTFKKEAKINEL